MLDRLLEVNFVCPVCGHDELVAIHSVEEAVQVTGVWDDSYPCAEYGDVLESSILETLRYECGSCYKLIALTDPDLLDWLKVNNMTKMVTKG